MNVKIIAEININSSHREDFSYSKDYSSLKLTMSENIAKELYNQLFEYFYYENIIPQKPSTSIIIERELSGQHINFFKNKPYK